MPVLVAWAFAVNKDNPSTLAAVARISWGSPASRLQAATVEVPKAPHERGGYHSKPPEHPLLLLRLYQVLQPGTALHQALQLGTTLPLLQLLAWTLPRVLELAMCLFPVGAPKFRGHYSWPLPQRQE